MQGHENGDPTREVDPELRPKLKAEAVPLSQSPLRPERPMHPAVGTPQLKTERLRTEHRRTASATSGSINGGSPLRSGAR